MPLTTGHKLSQYEIVEPIGQGGMGEVYRARDTKLGRDVAIKVLPDEFARDEQRLARFKREAKVLAALNHPGIASIYGLEESEGAHYLVLELVPGETLQERIARGAIPVEEALRIAVQVAGALEQAHEQGIVHRDLKPGNIKLTPDGDVVVLDFGLAKAFFRDSSSADGPSSSTVSLVDTTRVGAILGTVPYMSPEQAAGQGVDKRSDIFSFGSVLYEMLTGCQAFGGAEISDILAAVLEAKPDWTALPATVGPGLHRLLRRCLEKARRERQRDIGDVRLDILDLLGNPAEAGPGVPARRQTTPLLVVTALVAGTLAGVVVWNLRPSPPRPVTRFAITLPADQQWSGYPPALSPDGARVVYAADGRLYLRAMDEMTAEPIRGTEGGIGLSASREPFFSPDGHWLGFVAEGELRKVSVTGGAPVTLCEAGSLHGPSWGPNDTIVFQDGAGKIMHVSANGGAPEILIPEEPTTGAIGHFPQMLPDGKTVLFTLAIDRNWDEAQIVVQSLETHERRVLVRGGAHARYLPSGHLVYALGGTVMAVPFDSSRLEVTGSAVPVIEDVRRSTSGWATGAAHFSVSDNGSLVFVPRAIENEFRLVWVDREGTVEPMAIPPSDHSLPRLSPGGDLLAFVSKGDIWVYDIPRGASTRLTFDGGNNSYVGWMPDGERVAFSSTAKHAVVWRAADGSGASGDFVSRKPDPLFDAVSPDGRFLAFHEHRPATNADLWILPIDGASEPRSFLATPFLEHGMAFSPDGRAAVYVSNESGRDEVYVQPFPGPGGKIPISTDGGNAPVWARSGRELFYRNGDKMMVVDITTEPGLAAGGPRLLFEGRFDPFGSLANFDVTPDGQRFVMIQENPSSRAQFNVVLNWYEELKLLVPTELASR